MAPSHIDQVPLGRSSVAKSTETKQARCNVERFTVHKHFYGG